MDINDIQEVIELTGDEGEKIKRRKIKFNNNLKDFDELRELPEKFYCRVSYLYRVLTLIIFLIFSITLFLSSRYIGINKLLWGGSINFFITAIVFLGISIYLSWRIFNNPIVLELDKKNIKFLDKQFDWADVKEFLFEHKEVAKRHYGNETFTRYYNYYHIVLVFKNNTEELFDLSHLDLSKECIEQAFYLYAKKYGNK